MRPTETIIWSAGEHEFRLAIGELRAIEQQSNAGVAVILRRLMTGDWYIDDIAGVLRLGLVGAGMPQNDAKRVIERAMAIASPYELAVTATDVLRRFILFEGADQPGEPQAGAGQTESPSQTDSADGPTSSPQEPPAGSHQETSTT